MSIDELIGVAIRVHDLAKDDDTRMVARLALAACKLAEDSLAIRRLVERAAEFDLDAPGVD